MIVELLQSKLLWATVVVIGVIYVYLKHRVYAYWQRHGVPCVEPGIPLGNITWGHVFGKSAIGEEIRENYKKMKQHPFHGYYVLFEPVISINDPDLIRDVLVKDFSHFCDRGWFFNEKVDPMSGHLFILPGERWKKLRGKLSPIFTSGKLKQMYSLFSEVSDEMIELCQQDLKKSDVLEMKDVIARYTTDIISSIVYGFKSNSLKNPKNDFRRYGLKTLEIGRLVLIFAIFIPDVLQKLVFPLFNKEINNFFLNLMNDVMSHRRKEKIVRKDFLNLLMQLMDHGELEDDDKSNSVASNGHAKDIKEKLSMSEAAAQAFVFFVAGYETASSTATYCVYELAKNPDIQERLQREIDEVAQTSGINYDTVMNMEYLDMVFNEALRKYPSVPFLNRICVDDYKIPGSNYTIPKGMRVVISASGIQGNPEYYPDPEKFDPERFTKENSAQRNSYVNLGFGDGPRHCIGKRFGLMQAKQALVALLQNYKFHVCEKTPIPVIFDTGSFVQSPATGIYLRLEKRRVSA